MPGSRGGAPSGGRARTMGTEQLPPALGEPIESPPADGITALRFSTISDQLLASSWDGVRAAGRGHQISWRRQTASARRRAQAPLLPAFKLLHRSYSAEDPLVCRSPLRCAKPGSRPCPATCACRRCLLGRRYGSMMAPRDCCMAASTLARRCWGAASTPPTRRVSAAASTAWSRGRCVCGLREGCV